MTKFVLITGNGRSGSNRLLDILDRSEQTVCRNEANGAKGGQFNTVGGLLFDEDLTAPRQAALENALANASTRRAERDRPPQVAKPYFRPKFLSDTVHWATSKTRARRLMAQMRLLETADEWPVSRLYADLEQMRRALLVLKLNAGPAWTRYLHDTNPDGRFIHNIRHPRDYLNSWYNRFAKAEGPAHFELFWPDVPRIFAHYGRDDFERLHSFSKENVMEIELWRWRFTNETLHQTLGASPRGLTVTYADIETDPEGSAAKVYDFVGLPFNDEVAALVQNMRNTLFAKKHTVKLEDDLIEDLTTSVMDGSPLLDIPNLF